MNSATFSIARKDCGQEFGGGGGGWGRGVPESSCCEKIKESYKARKEASRGIGSHLEPGRAPLISKTEGGMDKVWR